MSESREAWIALNLLTDLWPALRARLVEACDGPVGVLNGERGRLRSVPGLRTDIITKIEDYDWKSCVCIELEKVRERGFTVLTPADASYPAKLLEIHDPPARRHCEECSDEASPRIFSNVKRLPRRVSPSSQ